MAEYELYHYGVKGMKWGIRKATDSVTRYGKSIQNAYATERYEKTMRREDRLNKKPDSYKRSDKLLKLKMKQAKFRNLMERSMSSLSQSEIERGRKHYKVAKVVGRSLLAIGMSALTSGLSSGLSVVGRSASDIDAITRILDDGGKVMTETESFTNYVQIGKLLTLPITTTRTTTSYVDVNFQNIGRIG